VLIVMSFGRGPGSTVHTPCHCKGQLGIQASSCS
jgi:hypothetical protein